MKLRKGELEKLWADLSVEFPETLKKQILKPTGRGGVYAARDYIHACAVLAEFNKENPSADKSSVTSTEVLKKMLHSTTKFRLNMYTPCLAYRFDELKPKEQDNLFDNKDIIVTEKQNGVRGVFVYAGGRAKLYSRNYSLTDCSLPEYWGNVLQEFKGTEPFAMDFEIKWEPDADFQDQLEALGLETDSMLESMSALLQMNQPQALKIQQEYRDSHGKDLIVFRCISVLYYKGVDYRKRTLGEAYAVEKEAIEYARSLGLNAQPIKKVSGTRSEKEAFVDSIIDNGGEGAVFHNMKGAYNTSENRSKDSFIKLKRSVSSTRAKMGLGDTIDGFITGFTMSNEGTADEGLIGSLEVSAYLMDEKGDLKPKVIAYVPNIERKQKEEWTIRDFEGKPTLASYMYNVCVELDGQEVSRKSQRLTHPRLIRLRHDKVPTDCVYTKAFWESQMNVNLTKD